ncbi:hypothetical protein [Pseudomonas fluorescens]|uniref:hypothetical protein n=1 Tax=Pseudomonas fluorescens TaxID=294 RepID=UPI00123EE4AD|nr:hypothetical protein [Pseudomonas fluorescens]
MVVQGWGQSPWKHEKKANFRRVVEGFSAGGKSPAVGRKGGSLEEMAGGRMDFFWRGYLSFFADPPVGASLLAMDVNDYAFLLNERVVFTTIASKLAPTGDQVIKEIGNRWVGCQGAYRGCRRP